MKKTLEKEIVDFVEKNPKASSSTIHANVETHVSLATIKRTISKLLSEKALEVVGRGRGTGYIVSPGYKLLQKIDMEQYYRQEIDDRKIIEEFNFGLLDDVLSSVELFTREELNYLAELQRTFAANIAQLNPIQIDKEFERLAIDLSWKSSQIEGNTYSLLETERLLREKQTAAGKTQQEAIMLLNHKAAIDFIIAQPDYVMPLTVSKIEDIHSLLIKDLPIEKNIRQRRVGISGTNYRPLDNAFQINEALTKSCETINAKTNVFEQALLGLALLSYIQPFVDGNKRTARIVSNAILLAQHHCPISFRTVDSLEYKKAMLLFYEQNNISELKKIFIDQYAFAVSKYF